MTDIKYNYLDNLINLFCNVDDLYKSMIHFQSPVIGVKAGRSRELIASEVITIMLFGYQVGLKDLRHIYDFIGTYHMKEFSKLPTYKSFVEAVNVYATDAYKILSLLMQLNCIGSDEKLKFIDSTPIQVCKNSRIIGHKVCYGFANRGKTSQGWFYGFKVHMVVDDDKKPLSIKITSGNIVDGSVTEGILSGLKGTVIGDGAYIPNQDLFKKLFDKGIHLITGYRVNMKKLVTNEYTKKTRLRQYIEIAFGMLKSSTNIVSSLSRSVGGHLARIGYSLLAYAFKFISNTSSPLASIS